MKSQLVGAAQSKSIWFGAMLVGLGAFQANMNLLSSVLTAEQFGIATSIVGLIVIVLRAVTTESLAEKAYDGKPPIDPVLPVDIETEVRRRVQEELTEVRRVP